MFRLFLILIIILNFSCGFSFAEELPKNDDSISKELNIDDYEHFLQNIEKVDRKIHKEGKREDYLTKLHENKIDLSVEINNYFKNETPRPMNLEDCVNLAIEHNFNIRVLTIKQNQRRWEYLNNKTEWLPTASWYSTFYNLNGHFLAGGVIPTRVEETPIISNFMLNWNIFDGTNRIFSIKSKRNLYEASKKDVQFSKEEVLKNTVTAYYTLLGAKLGIEVLTQNLRESEAQLDINKQNFEAGISTKFDVLRAEAEVASAQQKLSETHNLYRQSQAKLANLLGVDVFTPVFPKEDEINMRTLVDKNLTMGQISDMAVASRPDLEALRFKIKSLECQKKVVYAGYLPSINVYGGLGNVGTNDLGMFPLNKQVGIITNWQLGKNLGLNEYTQLKNYDEKIAEATLDLQKRKREIQENIIRSYYDNQTAKERIKSAQEQVEAADESLRLAFLRLESGIGIYVDVLQSQSAKVDSKINLIRSIIDYNIAQANMLFDMGAISICNILNPSATPEEIPKIKETFKKQPPVKELSTKDVLREELLRKDNLEELKNEFKQELKQEPIKD